MSENLIGNVYGRLTVISKAPTKTYKSGKKAGAWWCKCSCGNKDLVYAIGQYLKSGTKRSCGCLQAETRKGIGRKTRAIDNIFYEQDGYMVGIAYNTQKEFYFDIEDFEFVKQFKWRDSGEYIEYAKVENGKTVVHFLHNELMNRKDTEMIDHINHNTYDNRRINLRVGDKCGNMQNRRRQKSNTSGVVGVQWNKNCSKWRAVITKNNKRITLGFYSDFDEAVAARKQAENEYFGEWSYDNSINLSSNITSGATPIVKID